MTGYQSKKLTAQSREGDLVKLLRAEDPECGLRHSIAMEAADYIEKMEKGFRDILTLDDPMLMQMISKACLTGAIDADGKYCFVSPFALGEKKDD